MICGNFVKVRGRPVVAKRFGGSNAAGMAAGREDLFFFVDTNMA